MLHYCALGPVHCCIGHVTPHVAEFCVIVIDVSKKTEWALSVSGTDSRARATQSSLLIKEL